MNKTAITDQLESKSHGGHIGQAGKPNPDKPEPNKKIKIKITTEPQSSRREKRTIKQKDFPKIKYTVPDTFIL